MEICANPYESYFLLSTRRRGVIQMLYGGLQLRDTDSIQANTNSQVFWETMRMRQQWFPGRFSFPASELIQVDSI